MTDGAAKGQEQRARKDELHEMLDPSSSSVNCTDQSSIYFRIKPSLAHDIWSLVRNHNVFFPDFVAAGIQNDVNKCHVIAYGARHRFFVRNWNMYPQILAVQCVPVTEAEIESIERALRPTSRRSSFSRDTHRA